MTIAYEPHPVSPERKAELRAAGFRIVDVRFKPITPDGGLAVPVPIAPRIDVEEAPKRTRRPRKESDE